MDTEEIIQKLVERCEDMSDEDKRSEIEKAIDNDPRLAPELDGILRHMGLPPKHVK